jgi:hypothetical protein
MIEVRNLQKQFGAVTALRGTSFVAPDQNDVAYNG